MGITEIEGGVYFVCNASINEVINNCLMSFEDLHCRLIISHAVPNLLEVTTISYL